MSSTGAGPFDNIHISFADKPVYLKRLRSLDSANCDVKFNESETSSVVSEYFGTGWGSLLVLPKKIVGTEKEPDYIRSAIASQEIYRKSVDWPELHFSHCATFTAEAFSALNGMEHLKRGVCICHQVSHDKDINQGERFIKTLTNEFEVWRLTKSDNLSVTLNSVGDEKDVECQYVVTSPRRFKGDNCDGSVSPVFSIPSVSPLYHSYEEARTILELCTDIPEVAELLKITDAHITPGSIQKSIEQNLTHPFVVVEGLDATGKTTLTQILEEKLGAARYYTPPPQIYHLRPFFDKLPEIVRRAYYGMGNYIVAEEIAKECQTRPVIMDRFWHSTTAYGIANETSSGDLPPPGYYVYKWPEDLLKPTLVLFLTVTEDVRKQRLSGRGLGSTFEEKHLDKDQLFRQRLCEAYRRMSSPACLEIDASGSVETVVQAAQDLLQSHNVSIASENKS